MDEINKNRHNKEQRAKYSTADIISPVKESGGNKSRQTEIKNASDFSETFLLFLRNKVNYSESALSYMGSNGGADVSENGIIKVISFFL